MRLVKTAAANAGIRRRLTVARRRRDSPGLRILNGFLRGTGRLLFRNRLLRRGRGRYLLKLYRHAAGRRRVGRSGRPRGDGISRVLHSLAVRDEFIIAGSAGPRRNVRRHAAGPTRPIIGDIPGESAARPEHRTESEQDCYRDVPLDDHLSRWIVESAASLRRAALTIVFDRAHAQFHGHSHGFDRAAVV
jgi:hypothetical protein